MKEILMRIRTVLSARWTRLNTDTMLLEVRQSSDVQQFQNFNFWIAIRYDII